MENKVLNALVNYAQKDKLTGLHISYYHDGAIFQHNHGYTDDSKNELIDNQTLFEIGSVTKPIVAVLYSVLLQENRIHLQKPVSDYFDPDSIHPIFELLTIQDILTHTSGLPRLPDVLYKKMTDMQDPYSCLILEDLYDYLKYPEELNKPGKYSYSNLGYGILAEVLKRITSKSLQETASELLFEKLGMVHTRTIGKDEKGAGISTGYTLSGQKNKHWHNEVLAGAGCFLSNGHDMLKFLIENINTRETSINKAIHFTHIPITKKTGMAWHYKNSLLARVIGYNGYIWHNGMTGGFSSFICFNKKKNLGLVLLANKAVPLDSYFYKFSSYF